MHEIILQAGYPEDRNRIYFVGKTKRHWITHPSLISRSGISSINVSLFNNYQINLQEGRPITLARDLLSLIYLSGNGVEIGALHNPSLVQDYEKIQYIDYISQQEQQEIYPDLTFTALNNFTIDDGEVLNNVDNNSINFIIANHFLEHTRNPIGVLRNHLRKIKKGGCLFYTIPNSEYSFDKMRPITSFQHLVMDDMFGPEISERAHYLEFVMYVDGLVDKNDIENHATTLKNMDNRIHFHVWNSIAAWEFFKNTQGYLDNTFNFELFVDDEKELVAILRKL